MDRVSRELAVRLIFVALIPLGAAVMFGCVQFGRLGLTFENWYDTYAMVGGGVAAVVCLWIFSRALSTEARTGGMWSLLISLSRLGLFLFAIYLLGVAGAFRLFLLAGKGFTWQRLLMGTMWVVFGYMLLYRMWVASELVAALREGRAMISDDASSMGVRGK